MRDAFLIAGSIFIAFGILFHAYAFVMESITWRTPKTWKTFGLKSQEQAEIIRPMAFNQGFYNLFLAIGALIGLLLLGTKPTVALTLIAFSALSMVGAGAVLLFSAKTSRRAAFIQAVPPLIGVILVLVGHSL